MIDLNSYFLIWIGIVGLCLGSFFNVVIIRSLSNESIVFPPSKCPKCGNKLYFWHNIPILSYILLKGKCYFCKEKISIQYPIVEFITMLLFCFTYLKFGLSVKTLFALFWVSCLIIMTGTDIKEKLVDCNIAIAMAVSGIVYNYVAYDLQGLLSSLIGLISAVIILEIIARLGYLFAGTRAMGEADTYVAGALGAIFGFDIFYVLLAGLFASMIFILPMFFYKRFINNDKAVCICGVLFVLSILIFKTIAQNYFTLAILMAIGITLAVLILKSMRSDENRSYLPYVPALAAGALYFLFI